jgi:hypothetical protein
LTVRLVVCALVVALAGCQRKSATSPAPAPAAERETPAAPAAAPRPPDPPRLPEEDERQLIFDHGHLRQHRALVKLIAAARARYDHARTDAARAKTRADMPGQITEMQRRVTEIDHWGVNSRLLPEYAALQASLANAYPDAKLAAIKGDAHALADARADFDQRMKKISDWLERAAEDEDE